MNKSIYYSFQLEMIDLLKQDLLKDLMQLWVLISIYRLKFYIE